MNLPNWTGGCTRHEVRVAIEVKHLMRALGGPHEYLGSPKDPLSGGVLVDAEEASFKKLEVEVGSGSGSGSGITICGK